MDPRQPLIALAAAALVAVAAFADEAARPAASIGGTIRDAKGKAIAGAAVSVEGGGSTKTAADGMWSVAGVAPGDVLVTAQSPGRFRVQAMLHVASGESRSWDATIGRPGEISGRLVDEYGHALTGVTCRNCSATLRGWRVSTMPEPGWLRAAVHDEDEEWGTFTAEDGAFSVFVAPGGLSRLRVGGPASWARAVLTEPMSGGLCDLTIRVPPSHMPHARVHCRLEGPDGAVLTQRSGTRASIHLMQRDGDCSGQPAFDSAAGKWVSAPVAPGTYTPLVFLPPLDEYEFPAFEVKDAADVDLGTLRLPPRGRVTLVPSRSGLAPGAVPVVMVRRRLSHEDDEWNWRNLWHLAAAPVAETDAPIWLDLEPGRYTAVVNSPRFDDLCEQVEVPFEVVSGKTTAVTVPLRGAARRWIRLRYPGLRPALVMLTATGPDGLIEGRETVAGEANVPIRLVPGRHALVVLTSDLRRLTATLDIPEENAPDVFNVVLR